MPTPPVNTVSPLLRQQEADRRNDSTPVRLFIAVFCQPAVVFRLHMYFYILLCRTWFLGVVEKWRGWIDAEGGRCRRWRQMAEDSTEGPEDPAESLVSQVRNHPWLPTALCTESRLLAAAGGGPGILHCSIRVTCSLLHTPEQGELDLVLPLTRAVTLT